MESQGNIEKEVVFMEIDDDNSIDVQEKPGVRLQRLRNELQDQIAKRKSEIWQNKSTKPSEKLQNGECEDEPLKSDYEADVDILDDEDEEEMSESSEDEEETDDEENGKSAEKEKKKSAFIDEEAEESDIEDDEAINNDSDKENEEVVGTGIDENSDSTNISEVVVPVKKPLRRIVKGFTEDSDDDEPITNKTSNEGLVTDKLNGRFLYIYLYIFIIIITDDDDMIPPHQIQNNQTPIKNTTQETQNSFGFDFLTPVSYVTGIKNLTHSAGKVSYIFGNDFGLLLHFTVCEKFIFDITFSSTK